MKLISFHLPQFHEIPENNEWWGNGFTEWTNTKKSKPLFDGHRQPREPLEDKYYDLSTVEDIRWQTEIAKRYGIGGFCFYHYWFDGKLLLEKPVNLLLEEKNIDFPFCLCWANEPWTRSWDGKSKEILIEQKYGEQSDWEAHFNYLIKFFLDERYIKVDSKPVLVLYRPSSIDKCSEMLDFWKDKLLDYGIEGLYIIEMLTSFDNEAVDGIDASVEFEPMYTVKHHLPKKELVKRGIRKISRNTLENLNIKYQPNFLLDRISYDCVWNSITNRKHTSDNDKKNFLGAFVDWDNSPRKGNNALILDGFSIEKFQENLELQIKKSKVLNNEFLFVNAWNEWAEGTYLEPDKENGFKYLDALKKAMENTK